ncbi:uncharacterized protein LOC129808615 [Phlebotomus papatasi]|uniref:uncharacterized protein LOC129808615 n=1 Tax=Phlebotomus papatasi TaxID=29031 RepID=UPI00248330E9|nr:uncharacterized protein LOC129808615 [Phlebotomus papatasi]
MKKGWDEPVTPEYQKKWAQFLAHLQDLASLEVPRWISDIRKPIHMDLHVFCDTSMKAYGVAIYCVTTDSENRRTSRLLTAKSRVAPLQKLTIPRLELCGALLAATYADRVKNIYAPDAMYFWCDSSVVISWINRPPSSFKIFFSNRMEGILKLSTPAQWKHVPTHSNPADLISRGVTPQHLRDSQLWWFGPKWIVLPENQWPISPVNSYYPTEEDKIMLTAASEVSFFHSWIMKYSSSPSVQRFVGHCLRFIHNTNPYKPKLSGVLTTEEFERALICLIYTEQQTFFKGVPELIKRGALSKSHWKSLCSLNPFIDDRGIIRVGGRLKNADTSFDAKHPMLLPKSRLALLLARHEHQRNLHAPPTLLLAIMRLRFWPLGGRNLVRKVVHDCVSCFKAKPVPTHQLMGDLPRHRVTLQKPFYAVRIDLCGPIYVKPDIPRPRGALRKIYIVVFVCLATKATHLEIVHDQSTEEFLQSFRRFCARRSRPQHVYSDCGKNFEEANNELARLLQLERNQEKICMDTRDEGILWHFNPPGSPHQGGLWEACVKSLKYHLIKMTNGSNFPVKDLSTLLCQIEAVLNSRPLCKLSDDPNDDAFLTPGHFLIGAPLVALPDPDCTHLPLNRLSGSQFCQRKFQEFSKRWHRQYLNTLQQRVKWKSCQPGLMIDDAVLLLDETGRWVLGRIVETHPGHDGHTRVVSVRTKRGTYKRAITKCAKLPTPEEMDSCSNMEQPGEDVQHSA